MHFIDKAPIWVQVIGVLALLILLAAANLGMNNWKEHTCVSDGGRFIKNVSDSNYSTCLY